MRHGGTKRQHMLRNWDILARHSNTDKWTLLRSHKMDNKLSSSKSGKYGRGRVRDIVEGFVLSFLCCVCVCESVYVCLTVCVRVVCVSVHVCVCVCMFV